MADAEHRGGVARLLILLSAGSVASVMLAACAVANSNSADGSATQVSLRIKVPNYGEFGLGSTEFHFAEPLTEPERRIVRLATTTLRANELVAAAATVSRDGRDVTVVAATARRRSPDRRLHGLAVDGEARAHSGEVEGADGFLVLGPPFVVGGRAPRAARSGGAVAHPAGAGARAAPSEVRNAPACPAFERALERSLKPVLLSGRRYVRLPSRMPRNGSKAVDNRTPAGLFLDQVVGELCRRDFESAWLRGIVSHRG